MFEGTYRFTNWLDEQSQCQLLDLNSDYSLTELEEMDEVRQARYQGKTLTLNTEKMTAFISF